MRVEYDPQADAMYIRFRDGDVADSDEIREGVVVDYDAAGEVLGIELLSASRRTDNPAELAVTLAVRA
ncbi:MAG: DUF2283 domain-containing protein [Burkholderiaceae bacterium]|jgi:uncharacterized protein YuzE